MVKLTESQKESFELLHVSITNGLMYAEDLLSNNGIHFKETMPPVVSKLRWLKSAIELKIPSSNRAVAQKKDHLLFDEFYRLLTKMDDKQRDAVENFAKTIL